MPRSRSRYYVLSPASKAKGVSKNKNKNKSRNIAANKVKAIQRTTVKVVLPEMKESIDAGIRISYYPAVIAGFFLLL
ncbi:MAG: hypothetical protein E7L01_03220 [Paenibacillus macerans]|uniref:hypothetical protein n=1 Tax=Paenibacillus TaxID=44249 RepID=UPI001F0E63A8|nr:hypothetical protein [Paenibacillus macerans]MDU7472360.1 hypothetical protein [Paenibacillus macerans]UMV48675.1 hypothetical protein LMZ02_04590 [Paenibacillus macerans]